MFGFDQQTIMGIALLAAGFLLANIMWIYLHGFLKNRAIRQVRREFSNIMPITIEQLEAERRLNQARTALELQHLMTRIAEAELREAESEAKVSESLGIIGRLHNQIELLNLEIAARSKREQLTMYSSLDQPKEESDSDK